MQLEQENLISPRKLFIPVLAFAIAALVYCQYGFHGKLVRDVAICLYAGQRMAEGVPPYVSIFYHKGPVAPMLAGLGVMVSKQLGWNDIYTVRLVFLIVSCSVVVSVYLLGNSLFQSRRVGSFAALAFLGFGWFSKYAASGPRFKTPMVLFETLSLLLTSRRRWFWAGLCGSLSFLTWQPTAIFPLVTLLLATTGPRKERFSAISRSLAGISLPVAVIGAYFHYHDALYEFLGGLILFNVRYVDRPRSLFVSHFRKAIGHLLFGYNTMWLSIYIGFIMVVSIYLWRRSVHRSFRDTLSKDEFAPILWTFPALVVWSLVHFQGGPDFYVFLPYVAIGFARLLRIAVEYTERLRHTTLHEGVPTFLTIVLCMGLIAQAWINVGFSRERGLDQQKQAALEIERRFGNDAKLASIGVPEVLVLLHRTNPTPYAHMGRGFDRWIHDNTPGGFEGWLQELEAYDADIIAYKVTRASVHIHKLKRWLKSRYHREQVGPWRLFVRDSLDK